MKEKGNTNNHNQNHKRSTTMNDNRKHHYKPSGTVAVNW